jgi:hypothetical protein
MKQLFFLSVFFIAVSAFGQSAGTSAQAPGVEVISAGSISWTDIKNGFTGNDAACHCRYSFGPDSTFKLYSDDCSSEFVIETGFWEIKNKNTLILQSKDKVTIFQVERIADCRFFVPPNRLRVFEKDLETVLIKSKFAATAKDFSRNLAFRLGRKYFCSLQVLNIFDKARPDITMPTWPAQKYIQQQYNSLWQHTIKTGTGFQQSL